MSRAQSRNSLLRVHEDILLEKSKGNQEVKRVAISILRYLRYRPLAQDSVKGIAEWWIGEDPGVVEEALNLLLDQGIVAKRGDIFRLAHPMHARPFRRKLDEVLRTLQLN